MTQKVGVLVMAYGTPGSREEVEPYYTRIRHGRPPTEEQLADLVRRYDAIGGISPLAARTAAQVAGLAAELERRAPGQFDVRFGAKYTAPDIEETAARFRADGITSVIGLALTPHFASMGTGEYLARAEEALGEEISFVGIRQWYDAEGFDVLMAERVTAAIKELDPELQADALVLFTAHSLPARILENGDPYPSQLDDTAKRIAAAAGISRFEVAWQSAGRTPEPWIGPDILDVIRDLPARDISAVVICPVGFVSDHLEVLYDVDVDAKATAESAGVALTRTASLNEDPAFLSVLADRVIEALPR